MIKKVHFLSVLLIVCTMLAQAQTAREDFSHNINLAGDNYTAYQGPQKKLSAAPKGYEPCYMSHYGRHGSRYLIGKSAYEKPLNILLEAEKDGMLTEKGKDLLGKLKVINETVKGRLEELTLLGAQQHQQIAQRMFDRFPMLFTGDVKVDAKSSVVIRCILSMSNEVMELKAKNPQLDVRMDASAGDMQYIIYDDKELNKQKMPNGSEAQKAWNAFRDKYFASERIMNNIFSSESYWREKVKDPYNLIVDHLWKIAVSMQGTELRHTMTMLDLFTEEELYNIWLIRNANWYITYGPSPLNGGTQIYTQRNLIKKMVEEADAALKAIDDKANGKPSDDGKTLTANLRFGHEVVVMPAVCFLNLNGYGTQYTDLEDVVKNGWYDYRIFPMGSNIQMIFYTKKNGSADDALVKFLLNEDEATVPDLKAAKGCYYKWSDVRKYCLDKLAKYDK